MMRGRLAALLTTTVLLGTGTLSTAILSGCMAVDDMSGQQKPYQAGYLIAPAPGESVDGVAARFNVPASALIQANHLQPPYKLAPHQTLIIPPPASYTVRQGDSIQSIATNLGVDPIMLADANHMERPYSIHIGQTLTVPGGYGGPAGFVGNTEHTDVSIASRSSISAAPLAAPGATTPAGRPGGMAQPLPPPPQTAPVRGTAAAPPPAYVPPPPPPPSARGAPPQVSSRTALAPPPSQTAPTPIAPPPRAAPVTPPPAPAPAQQAASAAPPPAAGGTHFIKPVGGSVIEGFGAASGGQTNDGINIGAPAGTPVKASDSGTVIYTGNELAAFGNLVLIRHAGGYVTAYGHLAKIDVQKGSTVVQGQPIGTVGQTGSAPTPQLHFEIRQGSKPVDPAPFLGGKG